MLREQIIKKSPNVRAVLGVVIVLSAFGPGCENDFDPEAVSSACKKYVDRSAETEYFYTGQPDLSGLYCVSYSAGEDDQLQIDLINYDGNCYGPYGAQAEMTDSGVLKIAVKRISYCNLTAQCSCPYDISLTLQKIDSSRDLSLVIEKHKCEGGKYACHKEVTLPIASKKSGFACAFGFQFDRLKNYGRLNQFCDSYCDEGLQCTNNTCLATCETDSDCPSIEIYTCSTGLCIPRLPLEQVCD